MTARSDSGKRSDVMRAEQRRKAMQSNRGRTGPELALASLLWSKGLRYLTANGYRKRYGERLLGQPDLIFTRKKVVVFVDGCFWHGCRRCHDFEADCNEAWQDKIGANVKRDRRVRARLRRQGWAVIRVWEHDIRTKDRLQDTADRVAQIIRRQAAG